jgi:mono/diheme cytochrome c family protein
MRPDHFRAESIMRPGLLGTLLCGTMALPAHRVAAQVVDTTAKGAEPQPALLAPEMIDAGRKIFHGKGTCSGCHGDKLQGGPIAPALTGQSWRHITGTYDAIIDRVDNGLAGTLMVPHPGGISESQVFLVASYVYAVSHQKTKP